MAGEGLDPNGPNGGIVDRKAYQWTGRDGGADADADRMRRLAEAQQSRSGEQIDYSRANSYGAQSQDARGAQLRMADMMYARASGQTPSIAGAMADRQMGQAAAEQSSAAAGARGPAALALAQQGAAANTAAMQSNISGQAQINAANERMQAEQGATGAYGNLRAGDFQGQSLEGAQANAQANMNASQRQQNDAMSQAFYGMEMGVKGSQLQAQGNRDSMEQAGHFGAQTREDNKKRDDDAQVAGYVNAGVQAVGTVAKFASDERAKNLVTWGDGSTVTPAQQVSQPSNDVSMSKLIAHRALDAQAGTSGAWAVDMGQGMKAQDSEDLGLIRAKERAGAALTGSEESRRGGLAHRVNGDKAAVAAAVSPTSEKAKGEKKEKDYGEIAADGLSGIGKAMMPTTGQGRANPYNAPRMPSDEKTKNVVPLYENEGTERHWDADVSKAKPDVTSGASLSGPAPKYSMAKAVERKEGASGKKKERVPSYEELKRLGLEMQASTREQGAGHLAKGPAVRPEMVDDDPYGHRPEEAAMAASNRSMEAQPYTYKPGFEAMSGQQPGEKNVGPMAQNMAADPVASTAVDKDPQTGLLMLDKDKLQKITAGGVASLQRQVDRQNRQISFMAQRMRGAR